MATITEDYVSFETAKLLKEKGFDGDTNLWYDENGDIFFEYKYEIIYNWRVRQGLKIYPCSTLQMAMKWLREEYKLEIYPFHEKLQGNSWWYRIERDITFVNITEYEEDLIFASYEQACEAAIKYCLENLI